MMDFELLLQMEHYRTLLQLMSSLVHWHQRKRLSRGYLLRVRKQLASAQLESMACVMGRRGSEAEGRLSLDHCMQATADSGLPRPIKKELHASSITLRVG